MKHFYSFHGGIHPPENKRQSNGSPITNAGIPSQLVLPLSQHIGIPADPIVQVGQKVLKGELIAEAAGRLSAAIHAPTSGVVSYIGPRPIAHPSAMEAPCIVIDSDREDRWIEHKGLKDYKAIPRQQLITFIRNCGVAGMGGAGFPTDVKLHLGDDHIVNTLIINAAECEPYITADDMLIRERANQIIGGIAIMDHLLRPSHILIGIEDNKPQAIRALREALREHEFETPLDVMVVPTKYPSGGEKQLIKLLTSVEVPSGRIPADVGIVCQNVGTAAAIYRAVTEGRPLISRVVTITGDAVKHRHNLEVLIGTPFRYLLEQSGLRESDLYRLVMGGPMMGFTLEHGNVPVIKTTNCIIAATEDEMPAAPPAQPCIRCAMCEQVCPAELLPQQLYWFSKSQEYEKARHHNLFDCIECGACSYVCPSNIPLVQYYRFAKAEIRAEDAEQRKSDHARQRFEARQARLEQDKIDKEIRRKERAEQAIRAQAAKKDAELMAAKSAAKSSSSATTPVAEDQQKQLKTAAAVARTKLKKAQQALAKAEESGLDTVQQLSETVAELQQKADAAQTAFEAASSAGNTPAVPAAQDEKALKTAAAVARTKLKQAEKALTLAEQQNSPELAALQATVAELKQRVSDTESAYQQVLSGQSSGSSQGADQAKRAELQDSIEQSKAKVAKAQQALEKAIASASPAAEKMKAGVEKLRGNLKQLEDELASLNSSSHAAEEEPKVEPVELDLKALKQQVSIVRTKLKKVTKALDETDPDSDAFRQLSSEQSALQSRFADAEQAYEQAESKLQEQATEQGVDLKKLRIDAAMARASVTKLERALAKAEEPDQDDLQTQLTQARLDAETLNQQLARFE